MAKFCRYCGSQLDESARFCENCGNQVAAPDAPSRLSGDRNSNSPTPHAHREGTRVLSIALSALLVVQTAAVTLFGWPGFLIGNKAGTQSGPLTGSMKNMRMTELVSGTLSEESMVLEKDGVCFTISEVTFTGEATATISNVKNAPALMGLELTAYDFSVDTDEEPAGIMELTMPCDLSADEIVVVGYLNEKTGEWEPTVFTYDRENKEIIIMTDHLSTWGYTTMKTADYKSNMENLAKDSVNLLDFSIDYGMYNSVAGGSVDIGNMDTRDLSDYILLGLDVLEGADYVGDFGFDVIEALRMMYADQNIYRVYSEGWTGKVGNYLGTIGMGLTLMKSIDAYQQGDMERHNHENMMLVVGAAGLIAGSFGFTAISTTVIVLNAIDLYADLKQDASEAAQAFRREQVYNSYLNYYREKNHLSAADWYAKLYPAYKECSTAAEANTRVGEIVRAYTMEAFTVADKWYKEQTSYYGLSYEYQVLYDLATRNESTRKQMAETLYTELMTGIIKEKVFPNILRQLQYDLCNATVQEICNMKRVMTEENTLTLHDPEKKYIGKTVRFVISNRSKVIDPQMWEARFNEDGEATFHFTLNEHLIIGAPVTLEIIGEKDEVVHAFTIQLDPPHTVHEIGEDAVSGIRYVEGFNENRAALSIDTLFAIALREAEVIPLDKDGNFALDTYAEFFFEEGPITKPKGDGTETNTTKIEMHTQTMQMSGNWDGETGSFRFEIAVSGERSTDRTDVTPSSAKGYPDSTAFWQFRPTYEGEAFGTGTITREGDHLVFQCDGEWNYIYKEPYTLTVNNGSPQGNAFDDQVKSGKFKPAIRFAIVNGGDSA